MDKVDEADGVDRARFRRRAQSAGCFPDKGAIRPVHCVQRAIDRRRDEQAKQRKQVKDTPQVKKEHRKTSRVLHVRAR